MGAKAATWMGKFGFIVDLLTPDQWKALLIKIITVLLRIDGDKILDAWERLKDLILKAKEANPGPKQGDAKYAWVVERAKDLMQEIGPLAFDMIVHAILAWFARQKKET